VFRVYPAGFGFHLALRLRVPDEDGRLSWALRGLLDDPRGGPSNDAFRLAVAYADGRVAPKVGHRCPPDPDRDLMVSPEGAGAGGHTLDMDFWVYPMPPPGPLALICEWRAGAVPESRVEIDAQRLLDARARAVQLWPEPEDVQP
jgi:hypothetical protein